MEALTTTKVVIILQYISVPNPHLVHLNLCNVICQLHLNNAGEKRFTSTIKK